MTDFDDPLLAVSRYGVTQDYLWCWVGPHGFPSPSLGQPNADLDAPPNVRCWG
jgi:hypothetical protein